MYRRLYRLAHTSFNDQGRLVRSTGWEFVMAFFVMIGLIGSISALSFATEADLQDILEGFEDTSEVEVDKPATEVSEEKDKSTFVSLDGYFKLGTSYNFAHDKPETGETDWRGLSRLRPELLLELDVNLPGSWKAFLSGKGSYDFAYELKGRGEFTSEILNNNEQEAELREAYMRGSFPHVDLQIGRQLVVWGKSDNIRVTDILNPLDMREFGLTDMRDLRLPVAMTRLDVYSEKLGLTGIAIHEIRFHKNPVYGSDFYSGTASPPPEDIPSDDIGNTEFALTANGFFNEWDASLYWADLYSDAPYAVLVSPGPPPQTKMRHARLTMLGTAVNLAKGNWLLKSETASFTGLNFFNTNKTYRRTDILAGFEYSGFQNTTLSAEVVNRHIHNFDSELARAPDNARENEFQSAVRLRRTFLRERLILTLLATIFGERGQDGTLQRLSAEYAINDTLLVKGGIVLYQSGDLRNFRNIGDNDRIVFEITYSF